MVQFIKLFTSTLGKKIFMGLTGLALSGFIVIHLIGNLTLLLPDKDPFNMYAHFLMSLGALLYFAEFLLAGVFLVHFFYALFTTLGNWSARPNRYAVTKSAGHTSRKSWASVTMIWTGLVIIVFTVLHLLHFKFGEVIMYTTKDGMVIRDLYTVVYQYFANIWNVLFYIVVMVLLGYHTSHGVWSAFQSLGISGPRFTRFAQVFGYIFAVVMGFGFVLLPAVIFFISGGSV
jgi:succinate dehydrogenase / fumarate reductase cytochrome b subunit